MENEVPAILTSKEPLVEWLIEGFLPSGSLLSYAGEPGVGKSVFSFHLAICLACGLAPLGGLFPASPQGPVPVLYFDQENSKADHAQYLKWAWIGLGKPDLKLIKRNLWVPSFVLGGDDWEKKAEDWIDKVQPRQIFYDTKGPCFDVEDENDNSEAMRQINTLRRLAAIPYKMAAQFVMMHEKINHDKKEGRRHIRGAKAWEGATDGILFHTRGLGRPRKDGLHPTRLEPAKTRAFGLRKRVGINPGWVGSGLHTGLKLTGRYIESAGKPSEDDSEEEE